MSLFQSENLAYLRIISPEVCQSCGGLRSGQAEQERREEKHACRIHLENRRLLYKAPVFSAGLYARERVRIHCLLKHACAQHICDT